MKTIFITIPRGSAFRNFFNTGMVNMLLENGFRVVALTENYNDQELQNRFNHPNLIFEPLYEAKGYRFESLIREFLKGVIFNRTVNARYIYRFSGKRPNLIFYLPRLFFLAPLSYIPFAKKLIRFIEAKLNPQYEHDNLFIKYKPNLVFATTMHELPDAGVLKSANRFNVPTAGMPRSWDTISKILFYVKSDRMMVWSSFMKDQIIRFQDYSADDVVVTGVPQFDHYAKRELLMTRELFCQRFGFSSDKKIILYGSTGGNCFNEAEYIKCIQGWVDAGDLTHVQIIVRPHPGYADDAIKFKKMDNTKGFAVDTSDIQDTRFKDLWDISINHLDNLFNSLHHADLCINIASTLTLDAIACGTPVININFDLDPNIDANQSVKRLYKTDYINAIKNSGATFLADSKESFLRALKDTLELGGRKKNEEAKFIERFMYRNDGKSAERLAYVLTQMIT